MLSNVSRHSMTHSFVFLLTLFLLALVIRLQYLDKFVGLDSPPTYDGITYDILAKHILDGDGYTQDGIHPTVFRAPGYPLILAGIYRVFTPSLAAVRIIQAVASAFTVILLYGLGAGLFNRMVGFLSAIGGVFYPLYIFETGEIYGETIFFFLLILILLLMTQLTRSSSLLRNAIIGLGLGSALLIRPGIVPWIGFVAIFAFFRLPFLRALKESLIIFLFMGLVILPWTIRNYIIFHEFIPLTVQTGVQFWEGNNALAMGDGVRPDQTTWPNTDFPDLEYLGWSNLGETESSRKFLESGMTWVRENPGSAIALVPLKIIKLWSPLTFTTQSSRALPPVPAWAVQIPYFSFLLLVGIGIWISRSRWREFIVLYGLIVSVQLIAILFFGGTRFSLPMSPILILFAAVTIDALVPKLLKTFKLQRDLAQTGKTVL